MPLIDDDEEDEDELPPKHPAKANVDINIIMIENFFINIPITKYMRIVFNYLKKYKINFYLLKSKIVTNICY